MHTHKHAHTTFHYGLILFLTPHLVVSKTYNDLALQVHKISGALTSLPIHNSASTYFFTLFLINIILHILSTTITFQKYITTSHHVITYHNTSWVITLLIAHFIKCSNWKTQNYILLCNKLIIFILFPKVYMPTPLLVPYFFFLLPCTPITQLTLLLCSCSHSLTLPSTPNNCYFSHTSVCLQQFIRMPVTI